jgi:hypothetical protein
MVSGNLLHTWLRRGAGRFSQKRLESGRLAREWQLLHPLMQVVRHHRRSIWFNIQFADPGYWKRHDQDRMELLANHGRRAEGAAVA